MFDLQPPRHISTLRVSPVAPRPREGPLTEPTAGAQPWPRERVLMPHKRPYRRAPGFAELGGIRSFPTLLSLGCRYFESGHSLPETTRPDAEPISALPLVA